MNNEASESGEELDDGAESFVRSQLFARTFSEGMSLVEETANYLDGEGRSASKALSRPAALAYAGASMRLTTQLMQIASWLLVMRAVREGELSIAEARDQKYRLNKREPRSISEQKDDLPGQLQALALASDQLFERIYRLDATLFGIGAGPTDGQDAAAQQRILFEAFGAAG